MVPTTVKCPQCNASVSINSYRKFVVCPYCHDRFTFEGFEYKQIDRSASKYAYVKYEMDCPACRGKNMLRWSKIWKCEDCGYTLSRIKRLFGVLWFCDECEAYLNVQAGFTTKNRKWECTECGHINGTTRKDIL